MKKGEAAASILSSWSLLRARFDFDALHTSRWTNLKTRLLWHSNEVFRESSSNRRNLKTPVLRFSLNGKHFENGAFQKQKRHHDHVISLQEFYSHKSKMTADNCVFKFLRLGRKTFDAFSKWKHRFEISPAQNERIVWRIADNVSSMQKGIFGTMDWNDINL